MAFENNRPANFSDVALAGRDISARRAATIANMVDEAAARGLDDEFARAAISPGNRAALSNVTDNIPMPPKTARTSEKLKCLGSPYLLDCLHARVHMLMYQPL